MRKPAGATPLPAGARSLGLVVVAKVRDHPLLDLLDRHALAHDGGGGGVPNLIGKVPCLPKVLQPRGLTPRNEAAVSC